jgi:hypothetical protein
MNLQLDQPQRPELIGRQLHEAVDAGVDGVVQQRQKDHAGIPANQRRFVGRVGGFAGRMDAEDVTIGLQGAAELKGAVGGIAGNDDRLDGRIGEDFFKVGDGADACSDAVAPGGRERARAGGERMSAGFDESGGERAAVGMAAEKCEAHGVLFRGRCCKAPG